MSQNAVLWPQAILQIQIGGTMVKDEELWGEDEEVVILEDEFVEDPFDTLADGEDYEEDNETVSATEKTKIEEDDDEEEPVEYDDEDDAGIAGFLSSNGNRLLLAFGALIALVLIGIGIAFVGGRARTQEVADFAEIGVDFKEIGIVGEENINLIFDKEAARLTDLYEAKENYDYDEADEDNQRQDHRDKEHG